MEEECEVRDFLRRKRGRFGFFMNHIVPCCLHPSRTYPGVMPTHILVCEMLN